MTHRKYEGEVKPIAGAAFGVLGAGRVFALAGLVFGFLDDTFILASRKRRYMPGGAPGLTTSIAF